MRAEEGAISDLVGKFGRDDEGLGYLDDRFIGLPHTIGLTVMGGALASRRRSGPAAPSGHRPVLGDISGLEEASEQRARNRALLSGRVASGQPAERAPALGAFPRRSRP
jgi:hypothetical protein